MQLIQAACQKTEEVKKKTLTTKFAFLFDYKMMPFKKNYQVSNVKLLLKIYFISQENVRNKVAFTLLIINCCNKLSQNSLS